jgi:hypothetical protein
VPGVELDRRRLTTDAEVRVEQIKNMDQLEAQAMLRADLSTLESIWDDKLIAYSTAALYAGKRELLDYIKAGGLRLRSHKRQTSEIIFDGGTAISIGLENSEMEGVGERILLLCSYMNVWTEKNDGWKLLARYVGRVSRMAVAPTS